VPANARSDKRSGNTGPNGVTDNENTYGGSHQDPFEVAVHETDTKPHGCTKYRAHVNANPTTDKGSHERPNKAPHRDTYNAAHTNAPDAATNTGTDVRPHINAQRGPHINTQRDTDVFTHEGHCHTHGDALTDADRNAHDNCADNGSDVDAHGRTHLTISIHVPDNHCSNIIADGTTDQGTTASSYARSHARPKCVTNAGPDCCAVYIGAGTDPGATTAALSASHGGANHGTHIRAITVADGTTNDATHDNTISSAD
jgi:hypothetical protein